MMEPLPLIATFFSLYALLPDLFKEKKSSDYSLGVTVLSLISVLVWLYYHYLEKKWIPMVEGFALLLLNLQILYVLLSKSGPEERSVFRQTSDGVYGYTLEECTPQE